MYRHIYLGCKEDDNVEKNFELLYTSLALTTIELANEEVVIDLIRLAIALQVCFWNEDVWLETLNVYINTQTCNHTIPSKSNQ